MKILAISGSLRKASYNSALLRALIETAPAGFTVTTESIIDKLPFFNPDIDDIENPPHTVKVFRDAIKNSDGLILLSPEYTHNISGVLKNALDWVVGSGELVNKPVVVINVSTSFMGGDKAHGSLKYLVKLISAQLLDEACFMVSGAKNKFDENGKLHFETGGAEIKQKIDQMFDQFKLNSEKPKNSL